MPPPPRPYGVGPYGIGPYERYAGNQYNVGGAAQISFATHASEQRVIKASANAQIVFATQGTLFRTQTAGAATQIQFATHCEGTVRIITLHPVTEIQLVMWGEMLESWATPPGCEKGTWAGATPCETGTWTAIDVGSPGTWKQAA